MSAMDGATIQLWNDHLACPNADSRRRLAEHYLSYAYHRAHVAYREKRRFELEFEEYLSYAVIGLLDVIDRFEPHREMSFTTYAFPRINGAIMDALRDHETLSRHDVELRTTVSVAYGNLMQQLHRRPNRDEVAEYIGLSARRYTAYEERIRASRRQPLDTVLMDSRDIDENYHNLSALVENVPTPEEYVIAAAETDILMMLIARLEPKDRYVVQQYFYVGRTLIDIGRDLGVSESAMCHRLATIRRELQAGWKSAVDDEVPYVKPRRGRSKAKAPA